MPKSIGDPAVEVADFISHAIGRQTKHRKARYEGLDPEFQVVFQDRDSREVSYIDIEKAVPSEPTTEP
jgi:hypothetical protein